jgi:hypothetical protein
LHPGPKDNHFQAIANLRRRLEEENISISKSEKKIKRQKMAETELKRARIVREQVAEAILARERALKEEIRALEMEMERAREREYQEKIQLYRQKLKE